VIKIATTAKQEIETFLASKEAGIKSEFKRNTLLKAAEDIFTANGLHCPVIVTERGGATYLINRDITNAPAWSAPTTT